MGNIRKFIHRNYRHFNAAALVDAAQGPGKAPGAGGGQMLLAMAGAMSSAELGISLAEMIRKGKCTRSAAPAPTWKRTSSTSWRTTLRRIPNCRDLTPRTRWTCSRSISTA